MLKGNLSIHIFFYVNSLLFTDVVQLFCSTLEDLKPACQGSKGHITHGQEAAKKENAEPHLYGPFPLLEGTADGDTLLGVQTSTSSFPSPERTLRRAKALCVCVCVDKTERDQRCWGGNSDMTQTMKKTSHNPSAALCPWAESAGPGW